MVLLTSARVFSPFPAGPLVAPAMGRAWANLSALSQWNWIYAAAAERSQAILRDRWLRQLEPGLN